MKMKLTIGLWVLVAGANYVHADVKLPALLSDNMVLQQQSDARFWGWADPGEKVEVQGSWAKKAFQPVTADKDGKWKMEIKTPKAGGPYTVTVKGNNTIELKNILIGDPAYVLERSARQRFRSIDMAAAHLQWGNTRLTRGNTRFTGGDARLTS